MDGFLSQKHTTFFYMGLSQITSTSNLLSACSSSYYNKGCDFLFYQTILLCSLNRKVEVHEQAHK